MAPAQPAGAREAESGFQRRRDIHPNQYSRWLPGCNGREVGATWAARMVDTKEWALPPQLRPKPETLAFELESRLNSMVLVHADVPEDAFTASVLGTQRVGNGVIITHAGRQVVLTIGYLITEAQGIWLTAAGGQVVPGHALAFDQVTGFGLVLPLGHLNAPSLELGSSAALNPGDELTVIGFGGAEHALATRLI